MTVPTAFTAPLLFAGLTPSGSCRCFFCGAQCDGAIKAKDFVKSSFTALDTIIQSGSVCAGCVETQNESASVTLACGEQRDGQKTRMYSWVFNRDSRTAATKAHRDWLMRQCLNPPEPPFVICITDSGQRQLLYRAVVCHQADRITVTLEGERIEYTPDDLRDRLRLCRMIAAATGKPALKEELTPQSQMRIVEHHLSEEPLAAWLAVQNKPLSRLAAWLCPAKEECLNEFPDRSAPEPAKAQYTRAKTAPSLFD